MPVLYLIGSSGRLNNDVNGHRMLVLEATMMTTDGLLIKLPQTKVICVALAETLEVIGQQNESPLDYLKAAFRTLQHSSATTTITTTTTVLRLSRFCLGLSG